MMGDGALSQDEINALLSGGIAGDSGNNVVNPFTGEQMSKIRELFSNAASSLSMVMSGMVGSSVNVELLDIIVDNKEDMLPKLEEQILDITVNFTGDISGGHYFILNEEDAANFGSKLVGQQIKTVDGAINSAYGELFSQFTGSLVTSISSNIGKEFSPVSPNVQVVSKGLSRIPASTFIMLQYNVTFEGEIFIIYELIDEFVISSFTQDDSVTQANNIIEPSATASNSFNNMGYDTKGNNTVTSSSPMYNQQIPNVQGVQLPNLTSGNPVTETRNISLLMDVMMELTVELGRTRWQIKDILGLGEGTIIELDKLAGEPVDILVNHNLIARGEVVVIDENFGVRVTEIVSNIDKFSSNN